MNAGAKAAVAATASLPLAGFMAMLLLFGAAGEASQQAVAGVCAPVDGEALAPNMNGAPDQVGAYSGVQLTNAAAIMQAGADAGVSVHGQTVGVMTAMGESTLRVLDRGDTVGPDSRGLFQQRANGAWGSYSDRMDPYTSATNFFRALQKVPGWETLPPTIAAHRTQRNADPYHYERYWDDAQRVVAALAGVRLQAPTDAQAVADEAGQIPAGALPCPVEQPGDGAMPVVATGGWVRPTSGPLTSGFGPRGGRLHAGVDLAPDCGTPIYAAGPGPGGVATVIRAGRSSGYGNLIVLDHGGGVLTRYAHMYDPDVLVRVGQQVPAGHQIGRVGSFGDSTGCHLHFEVFAGGRATNPDPWLAERGVSIRGG